MTPMEWLSDEAKGWKAIAGYVFLAAMTCLSLQLVVGAAMENWGYMSYDTTHESPFTFFGGFGLVEALVLWPFMEELLFRMLPLALVISFVSRSPKTVFGVTLAFAVLFASIHPYTLYGKMQVGIDGIFFGLVFLKCGGLTKRFVKAGTCSVATHSLSNLLLMAHMYWEYLQFSKP